MIKTWRCAIVLFSFTMRHPVYTLYVNAVDVKHVDIFVVIKLLKTSISGGGIYVILLGAIAPPSKLFTFVCNVVSIST